MAAVSQLTAKWLKLWRSSSGNSANKADYQDNQNASTVRKVEHADMASKTLRIPIDNAISSPLLRLPAELRNQIYSYLDLSSHTVEVLSLSKTEYNALDQNGIPLRHNPYPNDQIWYRIEQAADEEFDLDRVNWNTRRKRYASIQALFALPRVCQQLRAETMLLFYELPSFAFSDKRYNHAKAFPRFIQSLSAREKAAIRSIHWPLRQAREFYHNSQVRKPMQLPDRAFVKEFSKLPNLKRAVLRYVATDIGAARLTGGDLAEFLSFIDDVSDGEQFRMEEIFRRELAMRGMRKQLSGRVDVDIECQRTRRAAF